jgi:hypothetical protein
MKIYIDQGVDQRKLKVLSNKYDFDMVQAQGLEQNIKIAGNVPKAFTIGLSTIGGDDYLAGNDIEQLRAIIGSNSVNDRLDIGHVYAAYHAGCKYFVTNNPKSFIYTSRRDNTDVKRQQLEATLGGLKIVTIAELEEDLESET